MATLTITEFARIQAYWTDSGSVQVAVTPPAATQAITIGATSTVSAAFSEAASIVRLQTDTNCAIKWGAIGTTIATATVTSMFLSANTPEYFGVQPTQGTCILAAITT